LHHKNFKKRRFWFSRNARMRNILAFRNPFKGSISRNVVARY